MKITSQGRKNKEQRTLENKLAFDEAAVIVATKAFLQAKLFLTQAKKELSATQKALIKAYNTKTPPRKTHKKG